jgi:NAD+ kinase
MKPVTSFGIVAFKHTQKITDVLDRIISWSRQAGIAVYFHPFLEKQYPAQPFVCKNDSDFCTKSDILISIGGDGTFLSAVHLSQFSTKPVVGVNMGGIGFLSEIGPEHLEKELDRLKTGDYAIVERALLEASVIRTGKPCATFRALNDVFVNRLDKPKLASINVWIGNNYITEFRADGLIVATPSGSTAYSLAAGGPIVDPDVKAFLLTPICPHSLTERPLILPCTHAIRMRMGQKSEEMMLSADGIETFRLISGDELVVSYCSDTVKLMRLMERSHFDLLRSKLGWGKDITNTEAQ